MNLDKVKKIEVMSATVKYLIFGIIAIFCAIILETVVTWGIISCIGTSKLGLALGIAVILQFVVGLCLLLIRLIPMYLKRRKFELFLCNLEDVDDFEFLKANYYIVSIDSRKVLFCRLAFEDCANDWELMSPELKDIDKLFENSKKIYEY